MDCHGLDLKTPRSSKINKQLQTTTVTTINDIMTHQTGSFGAKLQLQIPGASCQNLSWAKVTNAVVFPRYVRIKGMAMDGTSTYINFEQKKGDVSGMLDLDVGISMAPLPRTNAASLETKVL